MREIITDELTGVVTLRDGEGNERIVKKGESVQEAEAAFFPPYVPPVPASVTPLQMRKALRQLGLKATVDAYVATLDEEAAEEWEYALAIERGNATLQAAAAGLGMTDEQADDLFRLAASM